MAQIYFEGRRVALSRTQARLVEALVLARGRYLTCDFLASHLAVDVYDKTITQYIRRARSAFFEVSPEFDQIECFWGFGAYRWRYQSAC